MKQVMKLGVMQAKDARPTRGKERQRPAWERLQHDEADIVQTVDPDGWPVVHARMVDPIGRLLKTGVIDASTARAARRFQAAFQAARISQDRAMDYSRPLARSTGAAAAAERVEMAKEEVWNAINGVGGLRCAAGRCLWHVVGEGTAISVWARRERWGKGRSINANTAGGILVGVCGFLSAHYERSDSQRPKAA